MATPEQPGARTFGGAERRDESDSGGLSVGSGASRIEEIIEQAQQSARQFVENAKRQADLMIQEAQQEARTSRADVIGSARQQVDGLVRTAEEMLRGVSELNSRLNDVVANLKASSERLQGHIDSLLSDEESAHRRRLGGRR